MTANNLDFVVRRSYLFVGAIFFTFSVTLESKITSVARGQNVAREREMEPEVGMSSRKCAKIRAREEQIKDKEKATRK